MYLYPFYSFQFLKMASRVAQLYNSVIKPHVPLIKFRKGASLTQSIEVPVSSTPIAVQPVVKASPTPTASQPSANIKIAVQNHEWWDTPLKFKRRQVDELEIDIINSGGSEKLYC